MTQTPSPSVHYADFLKTKEASLDEKARAFSNFHQGHIENRHFHYKRVAYSRSEPLRQVKDRYTNEMRSMLYLASNDYLNLCIHPEVVQAGIDALLKYGAGAGSVPLLGGTTDLHEELSQAVAKFKGCEQSVLFTSGFGANQGALSTLIGEGDLAVLDTLAHASIHDGCAHTNRRFFQHNDMDSLERVLKSTRGKYKNVFIVVDGVYSMDGDIAPLDEIHALAQHYGALIYVDEAHASGVIGEKGRGTPSHFGLEGKIDFVAGTFSKALGGVGGFVCTSSERALYLNFLTRNHLFSTAMTPQVVGSMLKSIEIVETDDERRARLWSNIRFFKKGLEELGFDVRNCETAIFPLILGNEDLVREATRQLQELNVYVNPVVFPAVAISASRIRMSLMANFSHEQLGEVLNKLEHVGRKLDFLPKVHV